MTKESSRLVTNLRETESIYLRIKWQCRLEGSGGKGKIAFHGYHNNINLPFITADASDRSIWMLRYCAKFNELTADPVETMDPQDKRYRMPFVPRHRQVLFRRIHRIRRATGH